MSEIELRLDPASLDNPDADLRYLIPDLLVKRSGGSIRDNGYDYEGDRPTMVIFLTVDDVLSALRVIGDLFASGPILGNDLTHKVEITVRD